MFARSLRFSGSIFLQAALIAAIVLAFWYLASTAAQNLRELRIASGFGFLERESGFAIGETTFLSHDAGDTYLRALLIGLLNTFRVAFLAIVLATLFGAFLAMARLSQNWLLTKLAAGYVELFRNTPLIVQLFFWYAAFTENLPAPAQAWNPIRGVFLSNRGVAFPLPLAPQGLWWTLLLTPLLAWVGLRVARVKVTAASAPAAIGAVFVLAGLFLFAVFEFEYPKLVGFDFSGGGSVSPEFSALLLGLALYTAAFIGEILRAGYLAVAKGQIESGQALGLSGRQVTRFIVLPQALRLAIPPLTSQYLNCVKNSSLAVAIGYPDLVSIANTTINQTGQAIEGFAVIMLAYLTVSLAIAAAMNVYNRRVALRGIAS